MMESACATITGHDEVNISMVDQEKGLPGLGLGLGLGLYLAAGRRVERDATRPHHTQPLTRRTRSPPTSSASAASAAASAASIALACRPRRPRRPLLGGPEAHGGGRRRRDRDLRVRGLG